MHATVEEIYSSTFQFLLPLSLSDTYARVASEATRLVAGKYASIFMPEEEGMKRVYASDSRLYAIVARKEGMTFKVYRTGKGAMRSAEASLKIHHGFRNIPIGSDITVPLTYEQMTLGVLSVLSAPEKKFTSDDLHTLELFAPMATLAIRKAQLHEELQQAIEFRDLFISLAAHELKTPLTTIYMHTQMMERMLTKGTIPTIVQMKKLLAEEVRLQKLVDEFLQVDNMKRGILQYDMQQVNLRDIVDRAVTTFKTTHISHSLVYKCLVPEENAIISGDYDKLLQVLINILNNAAKFSPAGKRIYCTFSRVTDEYRIMIKDSGVGIAEEDLPRIFDRFYKGKNSKNSGMGLGLYLVKNIIDTHHGAIHVDSLQQKGTTFTITLPTYGKSRS